MDLNTTLSIAGMIIGNTLCALAIVTPINGFALLFGCWLYNHIAGVYDAVRKAKSSSDPVHALKTTDAGPYTSPGSDTTPDAKLYDTAHPDAVPIPAFPHFALIALCAALAKVAIGGAAFVLETSLGGYNFPAFFLLAIPFMFLAVSGIYAAMLPTTFPRAMLVYLLALLPIVGLGLALFVICLSMMPRSFH